MRSSIIKILIKTLLTHTIGIYSNVFDVLRDVVDDIAIDQMVISHKSRYRYTLLVLFCICTYQYLEFKVNSLSLTACIKCNVFLQLDDGITIGVLWK